ncbi:uncharacterized protein TNCV_3877421 [Trichonephila clavipes]|uniref:Uncharacterized protein n=1 Tax=Trichonephila clavipes TaxID=2585209 RepID=A0A8X6VML4_TRICX|nr:uncharacterized protein TNCV_3877421 [Trichonephila clavipes]
MEELGPVDLKYVIYMKTRLTTPSAELSSRRPPSRVLRLKPTHQRLCWQWYRARGNWAAAEWNQVVFSDKPRFNLSSDGNRVRVWKPHGERLNHVFALQRHTAPTAVCDGDICRLKAFVYNICTVRTDVVIHRQKFNTHGTPKQTYMLFQNDIPLDVAYHRYTLNMQGSSGTKNNSSPNEPSCNTVTVTFNGVLLVLTGTWHSPC